jgi:hypothetical protein
LSWKHEYGGAHVSAPRIAQPIVIVFRLSQLFLSELSAQQCGQVSVPLSLALKTVPGENSASMTDCQLGKQSLNFTFVENKDSVHGPTFRFRLL